MSSMITHTMLVSFNETIPDEELDQFLLDIECTMQATGVVQLQSASRHIPVAGEEEIPALIATAVLQFAVQDQESLATLFAAPGAEEIIHRWQARHPYRVAFVNHETVA